MPSPEADLLKVSPNAGLDEIKKAYRRAALAHHPDHNPDPQAARHFRRLAEAYRLLSEQAQTKQPRPQRVASPTDRLGFLTSDIRALLRRWPADRWGRPVDGLPAVVWMAGALEVVAQKWPGAPVPPLVSPTIEAISLALDAWDACRTSGRLPALPRPLERALATALTAAEQRLRALDRPKRRP